MDVRVACCSIVIGVQTPAGKEEDDHYGTSHGWFSSSMLWSLRFEYCDMKEKLTNMQKHHQGLNVGPFKVAGGLLITID